MNIFMLLFCSGIGKIFVKTKKYPKRDTYFPTCGCETRTLQ